jgi:hypothetical protein
MSRQVERLKKAREDGIVLSRREEDLLHSKTTDASNLPYWQAEREKARKDESEESFHRFRKCDAMVRRICWDTSTEHIESPLDSVVGAIMNEVSTLPAEE